VPIVDLESMSIAMGMGILLGLLLGTVAAR